MTSSLEQLLTIGGSSRRRDEVVKELELVVEAKKNINSILTTMYYVFYALLGGLAVAYFLAPSRAAQLADASFAVITLIMLALITWRSRGTNDRCDRRAYLLEQALGMEVLSNYLPEPGIQNERSTFRAVRLHSILLAFDCILIAFWVVVVFA